MLRNLPALLVRTARACALMLAVCLVPSVLPGCGGGGLESPEAVFARVQELNAAGRIREIWDLYTDEERRRQAKAYDEYKQFLRTNPVPVNRQKCLENFRVEPDVLMGMSAVDIYVQQVSEPTRRTWLDGARILGVEPAPDVKDGKRVRWETAQGERSTMLVQYIEDGWYLVKLRE